MRKDIQCLRGIAIICVFLYHLFPTLFVNGFLGVDIFFVISGYLMGRNLTRTDITKVQDILRFYYRRFKRILPLYFLVIFLTVVLVHIYLEDFLWENNDRYSLASLFLWTNQLVIEDQADYFRERVTVSTQTPRHHTEGLRYTRAMKTSVSPDDQYVQQMNEAISFYEKFTKKIYIMDAHPLYSLGFLNLYLHYLIQKPDELESLHLKKKLADEEMSNVKKRFSMLKCEKCQLFDLSSVFVEGDKYLTFDRETKLSYVDNTVHITSAGLEKMDPLFKKLAEDVMDNF
ncbi:hypothetical protein CRE_27963 [Caenorhabditis remanei]|uniref:SGNH domain-containing protein n=1 Tax=Caenorhabditis remanei TaxID=31234 RepID=E3NQQ9_CAERE|nr:hypothetical protein CRE_27963 [Caenorhabditis remanei]